MCDDDSESIIPDADELLRGVPPDQWNFGAGRPSTGALDTDELCVDWAAKRTPDEFMERHNRQALGHGLIKFVAKMPRECGLTVRYDPKPADDAENEAHTLILGKKNKTFINAVKKPELATIVLVATKSP
jgi:hypothetical protein